MAEQQTATCRECSRTISPEDTRTTRSASAFVAQQDSSCERSPHSMLHERWSKEAWPQVKAAFKKALALRSEIRRAGWFN
jgi:hypothetical protein